jgi:AcrR family transcriptional regulator
MDPRVERTRAAVIEASRQLLLESGASAVTIDAVIQRTGVARSTIYRHFPTVTDVLRAGVEAAVADTPALLEADPASGGDPADRGHIDIRAGLLAYLTRLADVLRVSEWANALPGLLELVAHEPSLEEHRRELVQRHRQPLASLLQQARLAGALRADTPLDDIAAGLVGPLFYRRLVSGEPLTDELCQHLVDSALAMPAITPTTDGDSWPTNVPRGAPDVG